MKCQLALPSLVALLALAPAVEAARVVWVSDNGAEGTAGNGSDGVSRGAFYADPASTTGTPFTDQGFIDLLIAGGHTVERFNPQPGSISADDIAVLNTYDLVIVGSATNSGPFNLNSRGGKWNTLITKPMLVTKSTLIRRDRMGWLLDNKEYDCAADTSTTATGKLTFAVPGHPVFAGISTTTVGTAKVMTNFCNVIVPAPANNRGTSVQFFDLAVSGVDQGIANAMEPGGVLLADINFNPLNPGVNIPAGQAPAVDPTQVGNGYAIAEWPAFTTVRTTQVTGERLAGYRLFFGCGTRDASGSVTSAPNPQAGALDLSADGQQMFLKAVAHAASQPNGAPTIPNVWKNTSGDQLWNDSSINWSLGLWTGGPALFESAGAGLVTLDSATVTASGLEFTVPDYNIDATIGSSLTLTGTPGAPPTITVNGDTTITAPLAGTDGLAVNGASVLTLAGANTYSGSTLIRGGIVVMKAPTGVNGTSSYALDNIDALDSGATVKLFNDVDTTTTPGTPTNVRVSNGQMGNRKRLIMTGGTFDIAGDDNQNNFPAPDGTGLITNSSPYSRAALRMGSASGETHTFSGIMADGAPLIESVVAGKQGYRLDVDLQGFADDSATFVMAGLNTFTGFTRIGGGKLTFTGNGRWGVPNNTGVALTSSPNGTVICNGGIGNLRVDFNGSSQITGGLSGNGGVFANNAAGTVSTLTVGAANISNTVWPTGGAGQNGKITDNTTGTGGIVALTKTGTGKIGFPTALNDYSGPTLIQDGILEYTATGAPSPNSEIKINTPGQLSLLYTGSKTVKGLFINGVKQPSGQYGATTHPAFITGDGTITVPDQGRWNNASGDFAWNDTSANWSSPAVWAGGDAFFGLAGAGTVNITSPVTAHNLEIKQADYSFTSADPLNALTLAGSTPTITADAKVSMAAPLQGTDGLTLRGTSVLTLQAANTYTGGTFVRSGTLVLRAPTTGNNPSPYAVDGIDALDTGATVKFFNDLDVSVPETPVNVRVPNGQIYRYSRLVLTGGTFDLAGDDNQNQMPAPSGNGMVINSSPYARGVLKMGVVSGGSTTFSGTIADGGALIESVVAGKQGYRTDIDLAAMGDDTSTFVIAGVNTYTGFTRIGGGKLTFTGNGRWGVPNSTGVALTSSPNGTVICNGSTSSLRVDFNGTSQVTGGLSGNGGVFANNAPDTTSTLTVGAANISNTVWPTGGSGQNGKMVDNTTGTGGILGLTKTGTGTIGIPTSQNEYSGPTLINNGILEFTATGAPSPNSDHQINTPGQLKLSYDGTRNINGLFINGVRQPAGVYSAVTHPDFITGDGTLTIAQVHPTYPAVLGVTGSANSVLLGWTGVGVLQSSPDLDTWTNLPGASSPFAAATVPGQKMYYRVKQ